MAQGRSIWKNFFNLIAFVALAMIGVALAFAYIFKANGVSGPLLKIAEILAYIVVAFYAFFYVWGRRRGISLLVHIIVWAAAVTLIVVFVIIR